MSARTLARLGALPLALGLVAAGAGAAAAHVTVTPSLTTAGSSAVLTFSVGHGCDGSPTTRIAIRMPEQVLSVTPTRNPEWRVEKRMATLDEPVQDAHGNEVTERVEQVVYTARTPLPDGYRDTFELQLQLPDTPGETLAFPTIQTCQEGETAWIETPAEGGDAEELESPAPSFELDEAAGAEPVSGSEDTEDAADGDDSGATEEDTDRAESASDSDGTALGVAGLVAGLLGLAAGVAALVQVRRRA